VRVRRVRLVWYRCRRRYRPPAATALTARLIRHVNVSVGAEGRRALNVAATEMTSRHHRLISQLAKANEDVRRASVVAMETQLAANKASYEDSSPPFRRSAVPTGRSVTLTLNPNPTIILTNPNPFGTVGIADLRNGGPVLATSSITALLYWHCYRHRHY